MRRFKIFLNYLFYIYWLKKYAQFYKLLNFIKACKIAVYDTLFFHIGFYIKSMGGKSKIVWDRIFAEILYNDHQ